MTEAAFRGKRRQKFLTEEYFELNKAFLVLMEGANRQNIINRQASGGSDPVGEGGLFKNKLKRLKLHYTAGCAIEDLQPLYAELIAALGVWNDGERNDTRIRAAKSGLDLREDTTGLWFENLEYFQMAIDVASVGVLLGQGDAIRRLALWVERYRETDLLFESLVAPAVPDPRDNTDFFHLEPYDPLIDAFYTAQTPEESAAFMKKYLDGWYKAFKQASWHDGHLHAVAGESMPYYGYWAFEAAAVSVIHGIDDSSFRDHLLYPKDLADWARAHKVIGQLAPTAGVSLHQRRVEADQPCPREGWWSTPAKSDSRRHFKAGEPMPDLKTEYGATIWQWDEKQDS